MKGEYVKEEKDSSPHSMFPAAKLHQTRKYHTPPPPQPPQHHHSSSAGGLFHNSDEVSSQRSPKQQTSGGQLVPYGSGDGASIEVVRRPRGRPPGSKNKPKPPIIITRESEPSMSPYVLEIAAGADVMDSIANFCRVRATGICILNGSGCVSNVTLRQPSTTPGASVTFHGRFDILSLSATVLPPPHAAVSNGFTISLAGPQGQVVGGNVVGPLFTAGTVFLIAATFNSPSFHKLPLEEEAPSGSAAAEDSPSAASGGDGGGHVSGGESMFNSCQMATDVIWSPTARQPQPPY